MAFRLAFEKAFEDIADSRWSARPAGSKAGSKAGCLVGGAFLIFFRGCGLQHLSSFLPSIFPFTKAKLETDNDYRDEENDVNI